jgi:hypothetical protein
MGWRLFKQREENKRKKFSRFFFSVFTDFSGLRMLVCSLFVFPLTRFRFSLGKQRWFSEHHEVIERNRVEDFGRVDREEVFILEWLEYSSDGLEKDQRDWKLEVRELLSFQL